MLKIKKSSNILPLLVNLLIVAFVVYSTYIGIRDSGIWFFQYYTELSNVFGGVTSLLLLLSLLKKGKGKASSGSSSLLPKLRFLSTCCLCLTFIVVLTILAPEEGGIEGYRHMFLEDTRLFTHLLTPVCSFISYCFLEKEKPSFKFYIALYPTLLYAVVLMVLNYMRVLEGPYFFLHVYEQSLLMSVFWTVAVLAIDLLIAFLVYKIKKKK